MPYVINGFGTWNHGQKNTVSVPDFCESCNRFGFLSSYDTRRYIVALFLPVVPLGKKRILNHCPACEKWKELSFSKWETLTREVRENVRSVFENRPNDTDAVAGAITDLLGIQDRKAFESAALNAERIHANDARIMSRLAQGYAYFGELGEAERCYLAALSLDDSPASHEGLAFVYLQQKRAQDAAPHLRHILETGDGENSGLLYLLVEGLQFGGNHNTAHALVETVFNRFPDLEKDKEWKKLRKSTEKLRGSKKPLKKGTLTAAGRPKRERSPVFAVGASALLAILFVGVYIAASVAEGRSRAAHLVNGLERPYTVTIDGTDHYLPKDGTVRITLSEGTHTVHAAELRLPEETIEFRTNFFSRLFNEEVVVINPDRVAFVLWEETEYMQNVDDSARYDYALYTNKVLHTFSDVDFRFVEFPEEIELSSDREMKSRVSEFEVAPVDFGESLYDEIGEDAFIENAKRRFHCSPKNIYYVHTLSEWLDPDAFIEEIQGELQARPVLVEVHRKYQDIVDEFRPTHGLREEYWELLEADMSRSDLQYLYGRTVYGRAAMHWLRRSANNSNPYGLAELAWLHLCNGDADLSSEIIDKALELKPSHPSFLSIRRRVWMAQGKFDDYLASVPKNGRGYPEDYLWLESMVAVMAQRGDPWNETERFVRSSVRELIGEVPSANSDMTSKLISWLKTTFDTNSDRSRYLDSLRGSEEPYDRFTLALTERDLETALPLATQIDLDVLDMGVIYLLAKEQGLDDVATNYFAKVTDYMAEAPDAKTRVMGQALAQRENFDSTYQMPIVGLSIDPAMKRLYLAILADFIPGESSYQLRLSRSLNFDRTYPYHILDAYLTRAGY